MARNDQCFMAHALALGRRNLGLTWPNPSVGCVIVADDKVIARAVTGPGGRPHAETIALAAAGPRAKGATAYVSLEPCSHHGETPPCADALIAAGISRVVIPMEDPDERVAGVGVQALRAAGIEVEEGVLAEDARRDQAGFLSRIVRGRPHVHLKLAVSADGKIAAAGPARTMVTGELARARGQLIRASCDAVLIGAGTARADDPLLTCRLPGLAQRSPVRIVADSRAQLALDSQLVRTAAAVPVWVLCTDVADAGRRAALGDAGVTVIICKADEDGRIDLGAALGALGQRGLTRLMAEGGAALAGGLMDADLVDQVSLFQAAHDIGAGGLAALGGHDLDTITDSPRFAAGDQIILAPDTLTTYTRVRN